MREKFVRGKIKHFLDSFVFTVVFITLSTIFLDGIEARQAGFAIAMFINTVLMIKGLYAEKEENLNDFIYDIFASVLVVVVFTFVSWLIW